MFLEKTLEKRTHALNSSQRELGLMHGQNAFLAQKLKECAYMNPDAVVESFENVLKQVEHFHHSLVVSRFQIRMDQILHFRVRSSFF